MSKVICKFFDDFLNNNFSYVKTNDKINTKSIRRTSPSFHRLTTLHKILHAPTNL